MFFLVIGIACVARGIASARTTGRIDSRSQRSVWSPIFEIVTTITLICFATALEAAPTNRSAGVVLGNVSVALCPVTVKKKGQILILRSDESGPNPGPPIRPDPNTSGGFLCQYKADIEPGEIPGTTRITFHYYREERSTKYCDVPFNQGGTLHSTTHDIRLFVAPILDGADELRRGVMDTLEKAQIGMPCRPGMLDLAKQETEIFVGLPLITTVVWCAGALYPPLTAVLGELCAGGALILLGTSAVVFFDPPDPNYDQFAITRSFVSVEEIENNIAASSCQSPEIAGEACDQLKGALRDYFEAQAWLGAVMETAAISANRFNTARRDGDSNGEALQRAAWKVYAGMLRLAGEYLEAKSGDLLRVYGPERADEVAMTAAEVSRAKQELRNLELVPKSVIDRMGLNGFSEDDLRMMIQIAMDSTETPQEITLRSLLSTSIKTDAFRAEYESITIDEIALIVEAFRKSGDISNALANQLDRHLADAKAATTPQQRRAAMALFLEALSSGAANGELFDNLENAIATRPTKPLPLDLKPRDYIWFAAAPLDYR